jgi:sterol desaturase/sphingolipid hydroxylase (fatty acid hydroxylase superfamily)
LAHIAYRGLIQGSGSVDYSRKNIRSFLDYCFPKAIYKHPSAVLDYKYFLINKILYAFLFVPLFLSSPKIAAWTAEIFGLTVNTIHTASVSIVVSYTICALLAFDFSIFFSHFLQHKVPFLWQFHKVHHSAQVLTPITVYRMHPMDDLLTGIVVTVALGITGGAYMVITGSIVTPIQIFQVNGLLFIFYLAGYNLRHTHIWLNYPRWMLNILISPAQHQIHHSNAPAHFDKNFGFIFSIWDRFFRTIYIPTNREDLKFGLSELENKEFGSIFSLYFLPFKKAAALLRSKR